MGVLKNFEIDLKAMEGDTQDFSYTLDDSYFHSLETTEVRNGLVNAQVTVKKHAGSYELDMHVDGTVVIQCDRCLDDMNQPVDADYKLFVKFGPEYLDEGDDLVVVPEDEGKVNVAWFLYEIVALAIPIQHVHEPGACNQEMMQILQQHAAHNMENIEDENGESATDPRWNDLKKILNNN